MYKRQEHQELYLKRKESFEVISRKITEDRIAVSRLESEKVHIESMENRVRSSAGQLEKDISLKGSQLESLREERQRLISDNSDADGVIRKKEEEKKRLESCLNEISEEKADLAGRISELNSEKEAVTGRLESVQNQKYELEIKNAKNETQLDTYKNKLWEDFGVSYIQAMEFKSDEFVMSLAVRENREVKSRLKDLGEVNVGAIEEYETVRELSLIHI